jgi:hypothetical protein
VGLVTKAGDLEMVVHYDEKGKIFTNIITKKAVPTIIQTVTHRVHGLLHIREGERLKDELARLDTFLAVTDVTIFSDSEVLLYKSEFLAINREHIIWILPEDDLLDQDNIAGEQ